MLSIFHVIQTIYYILLKSGLLSLVCYNSAIDNHSSLSSSIFIKIGSIYIFFATRIIRQFNYVYDSKVTSNNILVFTVMWCTFKFYKYNRNTRSLQQLLYKTWLLTILVITKVIIRNYIDNIYAFKLIKIEFFLLILLLLTIFYF